MIALIQRVSRAHVAVGERAVGAIEAGILALIGVQRGDTRTEAERLLARVLNYRIFPDEQGRMNRHLGDVQGGLLLVPQFTLAADTRNGSRPGFSTAAPPEQARELFEYLLMRARASHAHVSTGEFGAHMQVTLTNDGPVTFWLESAPATHAQ
jgi:D-tyrosyl-tRNA(Tyr) deacylase